MEEEDEKDEEDEDSCCLQSPIFLSQLSGHQGAGYTCLQSKLVEEEEEVTESVRWLAASGVSRDVR